MDEIYKRLKDDTEIEEVTERSQVQEFFSGQTIFLTGSTGFVGKALVEKLLRSCGDLKKMYCLVRSKKESGATRMKTYFDHMIFDRVRKEVPNCEAKVEFVEGDLMKENLGLSDEDRKMLIREVTLMYHNASNVKFETKISVIIRANVYGTKYMLDLAKECKKLEAFMYVSTAYTHSYLQHIEDKCYPPPVEMNVVNDILAADEAVPQGMEEKALQAFRGQWANNYSFTKSIAESLVEQCGKQVPFVCSIYRPSVIISSYQEPIRGWCDNINGPVGGVILAGLGFVHAMPRGVHPIDLTPIDMCVNALITATWDAVVNKEVVNEATVYNYGSSVENPISMEKFSNTVAEIGLKTPTIQMMGFYYLVFCRNYLQYWFLHIFTQLLPALMADGYLIVTGQKPKAFNLWLLLTRNVRWMYFYVDGNWRIHVARMRKVWDRLNKRDAELFYCDLNRFDWAEYISSYWAGLRVYMLKDPMETNEKAKIKLIKLERIQKILVKLGEASILYLLIRCFYGTLFCPYYMKYGCISLVRICPVGYACQKDIQTSDGNTWMG